jgi:hypothetical protein
MCRLASAFLSSCLLLAIGSLANPAKAGDYYYGEGYYPHSYYGDYYRPHRHSNARVWYSSSCCYRKVVRHVRTVHYERVDDGYGWRGGYYEHPYRYGYYEHPYHHVYYGHPYYRYRYYGYHRYGHDYYHPPYRSYYYSYDSVGHSRHAECRLKPLPDGHGGFLPSRKAGCFSHAIW